MQGDGRRISMRATEPPRAWDPVQRRQARAMPSLEATADAYLGGFHPPVALFCCTLRILTDGISRYCSRDTCAEGKLAARQAGATVMGTALLRSLATR